MLLHIFLLYNLDFYGWIQTIISKNDCKFPRTWCIVNTWKICNHTWQLWGISGHSPLNCILSNVIQLFNKHFAWIRRTTGLHSYHLVWSFFSFPGSQFVYKLKCPSNNLNDVLYQTSQIFLKNEEEWEGEFWGLLFIA